MVTSDDFPIAATAERTLDRRRFLCTASAATLAVVGGEWFARREADTIPPARLGTRDVAGLAVGEARALDAADGRQVLVVRLDEAGVVAFDRRCPHLGCPVVWAAARGRFECPCHRAAFDARSGRVLTGPSRRGLTPVAVEVA